MTASPPRPPVPSFPPAGLPPGPGGPTTGDRSAGPRTDALRLGTTLGVPAVLGLAFVATVGPESLAEAAGRPAALAKMVGGLVAWVVLAWFVLPRLLRPAVPRLAVVVLLALVAAGITLGPYYTGNTVDEAAPVLAPAPAGGTTGGPGTAGTGTPGAPAPAAAPAVVARGEIAGIGHSGSGTAQLIRLADGSFVLRFEDLAVDNAPDAHVYLVPGAGQESPGGVRLDALKGNEGNQNYAVDAADVPPGPTTALIWCRAFSVPIAAATLG